MTVPYIFLPFLHGNPLITSTIPRAKDMPKMTGKREIGWSITY
jgi:hypothetical protein